MLFFLSRKLPGTPTQHDLVFLIGSTNRESDVGKSRLSTGQNIKRNGKMNVRVAHTSPGHNSFNTFQSILMSKYT